MGSRASVGVLWYLDKLIPKQTDYVIHLKILFIYFAFNSASLFFEVTNRIHFTFG